MSGFPVGFDLFADITTSDPFTVFVSGLVAYVGGGVVADQLRGLLHVDIVAPAVTLRAHQHRKTMAEWIKQR